MNFIDCKVLMREFKSNLLVNSENVDFNAFINAFFGKLNNLNTEVINSLELSFFLENIFPQKEGQCREESFLDNLFLDNSSLEIFRFKLDDPNLLRSIWNTRNKEVEKKVSENSVIMEEALLLIQDYQKNITENHTVKSARF